MSRRSVSTPTALFATPLLGEVEPDHAAVLEADQRRARVAAEARAVVRQRPASEPLHDQLGREPLDLVQVAEVLA